MNVVYCLALKFLGCSVGHNEKCTNKVNFIEYNIFSLILYIKKQVSLNNYFSLILIRISYL